MPAKHTRKHRSTDDITNITPCSHSHWKQWWNCHCWSVDN